ncbi:hypothetical protein HMPREF3192_01241 [Atopobium deltae]|uniref:Uncharacterized protein n=1 Tax=Atopobium deltae TaxID=1393034 RepID=A0A133XQQ3_9ACTN|nr:hypothetical protein HMPREF3192_01241 [Atopobium deltae]
MLCWHPLFVYPIVAINKTVNFFCQNKTVFIHVIFHFSTSSTLCGDSAKVIYRLPSVLLEMLSFFRGNVCRIVIEFIALVNLIGKIVGFRNLSFRHLIDFSIETNYLTQGDTLIETIESLRWVICTFRREN